MCPNRPFPLLLVRFKPSLGRVGYLVNTDAYSWLHLRPELLSMVETHALGTAKATWRSKIHKAASSKLSPP